MLQILTRLLVSHLQDEVYGEGKVYPDLDDDVELTGGAAAWEEGSYVELVASSSGRFEHVQFVDVTDITGIHQITLATGAASSESDFTTLTVAAVGRYQVSGAKYPITSRVSAKTASKAGGAETCSIKIGYVEIT